MILGFSGPVGPVQVERPARKKTRQQAINGIPLFMGGCFFTGYDKGKI
jgi:hypothetical protein